MFLHVGADVMVRMADVVAVFDSDSVLSAAPSREFLGFMRSKGLVEDVSGGQVKSMVVLKQRVVLSGISAGTLRRRVGVVQEFSSEDSKGV